jgi:predicted phosphohydrolase
MKRARWLLIIIFAALLSGWPEAAAWNAQGSQGDPVLVGAGDIATCGLREDEDTARLLDDIPGTVFTAGDNAYPGGTADQFQKCYEPTWGRHKKRTRPSPGNHDYATPYATPYYEYFGRNAGPAGQGYYSYNLGAWHIISLNSIKDARPESNQGQWLHADLKASRAVCTLVYWHHPLFTSADQHDLRARRKNRQTLYEFRVDVIVNGHVHDYERFAPQDPEGRADPIRGIRQFIVGTGGASLSNKPAEPNYPNSEVRNNSTWGVIKFTLHATSYDWEFIPIKGGSFRDSGSARCVGLAANTLPF